VRLVSCALRELPLGTCTKCDLSLASDNVDVARVPGLEADAAWEVDQLRSSLDRQVEREGLRIAWLDLIADLNDAALEEARGHYAHLEAWRDGIRANVLDHERQRKRSSEREYAVLSHLGIDLQRVLVLVKLVWLLGSDKLSEKLEHLIERRE